MRWREIYRATNLLKEFQSDAEKMEKAFVELYERAEMLCDSYGDDTAGILGTKEQQRSIRMGRYALECLIKKYSELRLSI